MMQLREHETNQAPTCPYCRAALAEDEVWHCPSCDTVHHLECARENKRCTVLGCASQPLVHSFGQSRTLRNLLLLVGLGIVLVFALRFSKLNGESTLDPVIVCLFFFGITMWGAFFDRAHASAGQDS